MNKLAGKLIGAAIGGAVGYFVGAVIAEIILIKEHPWEDYEYEDLDEDPGNDDETNLEPKATVNMTRAKAKVKKLKNYTQHFNPMDKPELGALIAKYNQGVLDEDDEPQPDYEVDMEEEEEADLPTDIQIISKAEYANNTEYEANTLKYYDDDVVTGDNDIPIDRPEEILGDEALISFGELSGDEDIVYVRNDTKKTVYEVIRANRHFAMHVERPRRHAKQQKEMENAKEDDTPEG